MNRYEIGRRIEVYRDKIRMSTQELAARIDKSQATISRIENGKQGLTFELLSRIASALRIHPFALLSDEPLRHSVLLPIRDGDEYAPGLLANALHAGRIRSHFAMADAAAMAGVTTSELETVELALGLPEDTLLEQLCALYGLPFDEMLALRRFDEEVPGMSRSLAHLQRIFSHIYHVVKQTASRAECEALEKTAVPGESTTPDQALFPDAVPEDVLPLLNRLCYHLFNAFRDERFQKSILIPGEGGKTPAGGSIPRPL